jgi:hypothetical protein
VQVDLRNRTELTLKTRWQRCKGQEPGSAPGQRCARILASGCTQPPRPNETLVVRYEHPDGYPLYRTVTTDAAGCFSDFLVVTEGGPWQVTAEYPGKDCSGSAHTRPSTVGIPLPQTGDADGDGLPDGEEPQGDHDGDGLPGLDDPDSDDDGVPDGREPPGDCDRDGRANVVDPDSDNDGRGDAEDPVDCGGGGRPQRPGGLRWSFHVGSAHPLGALAGDSEANIYAQVGVGREVTSFLDVRLRAGLVQLTDESPVSLLHPRYLHGSLDAQLFAPWATPLRPYVQLGPGLYRDRFGDLSAGANLGLGFLLPLRAPFALELGADYHLLLDDGRTRFLTLQLGALWR